MIFKRTSATLAIDINDLAIQALALSSVTGAFALSVSAPRFEFGPFPMDEVIRVVSKIDARCEMSSMQSHAVGSASPILPAGIEYFLLHKGDYFLIERDGNDTIGTVTVMK